MIYLSPGNKWSIPTILNGMSDNKYIEFLYRDKLGRIQKHKQNRKLMFKTVFRCGTRCTHCKKEGLHFELNNANNLRIATIDGFLNVEHIVPQSLGGTDIDYNVTIFCDVCNTAKGNDLLVPKRLAPNRNVVSKKKLKNKSVVKSDVSVGNINFGKFVKDLLLQIHDDNHSSMHAIYELIYGTHQSFKIVENDLTSNIKRVNDFLASRKYEEIILNSDITKAYYD